MDLVPSNNYFNTIHSFIEEIFHNIRFKNHNSNWVIYEDLLSENCDFYFVTLTGDVYINEEGRVYVKFMFKNKSTPFLEYIGKLPLGEYSEYYGQSKHYESLKGKTYKFYKATS